MKFTECNWEKEKTQGTKAIASNEDPFIDW
jgi:hypothetical protein